MKNLTKTALAASLACAAIAAGGAQADTLSGHVAGWVSKSTNLGAAPDTTPVALSVYLKFSNQAGLDTLLAAQTTKGGPLYRHSITPGQFRSQFAPAASSVAAIERELRQWGFRIVREPSSRFYIEAIGTVAQVKAAFGVSQNLYSFNGLTLRANAENPTVPSDFAAAVTYIGGLDDNEMLNVPKHVTLDGSESQADLSTDPNAPPLPSTIPPSHCDSFWGDLTATVSAAPSPYPATLPWLVCGYTPQQIREAYGSDKVAQDGTGARVAIIDAYDSPTIVSDANTYSANHGLPKLNGSNFKQVVPPDVFNLPAPPKSKGLPSKCAVQTWFTEETLDVESVHSVAPGATIIYVGAQSCAAPLTDALYDTIDGGLADIITNSWGNVGEAYKPANRLTAEVQAFEQAAVEGISILFSSGDDGDDSQLVGHATPDSPASNPLVTAVGGTSLALMNASGTKSEWGWGDYRAVFSGVSVSADGTSVTDTGLGAYAFYSGAGGGASFFFAQPAYQAPVVPAALATTSFEANGTPIPLSPARRVVPDVAMDADPYTGFLIGQTFTISNSILDTGCVAESTTLEYCEYGIGGTSLASPLFAGVLALVNQQRFANHLGAVGYVNPALYGLTVGTPGSTTTPLVDVQAPTSPTAVLRGYLSEPTLLRLVTTNSVASAACPGGVCEGIDDVFLLTAPGYDNVTGLGTPYVPALITALGGP